MLPPMNRWKYFKKPDLYKEELDEFLEGLDKVDEFNKEKRKKALTVNTILGNTENGVYHEENKQLWQYMSDKIHERERLKRGEEEE